MSEITGTQTEEYSNVFTPAELDKTIDVNISYDLLTALSKANRSVGRLDGLSIFLNNPDSFIRMFELQDVVSSKKLLGEDLSALDYFEAILSGNKGKSSKQIARMRTEIKELHTFYKSRQEISVASVTELYQKLYDPWIDSDFGLVRDSGQPEDHNALTSKYTKKYSQISGSALRDQLGKLFSFLQEDTGHPALMKGAMGYAQWNFLQPFEAHNTGFSTIVILKWLMDQKLISYPLLAINPYFESHRVEYQFRFLDLIQTGDWEEWLTYFILGVDEAAQSAGKTIHQAIELQKVLPESFETISGHVEYAKDLFQLLFNQPLIHIQYVAKKLNVAFGTANSLVQQFEEMDIVTEITGQSRNKRYLFADYFSLFFEEGK